MESFTHFVKTFGCFLCTSYCAHFKALILPEKYKLHLDSLVSLVRTGQSTHWTFSVLSTEADVRFTVTEPLALKQKSINKTGTLPPEKKCTLKA